MTGRRLDKGKERVLGDRGGEPQVAWTRKAKEKKVLCRIGGISPGGRRRQGHIQCSVKGEGKGQCNYERKEGVVSVRGVT